MRSCMSDSPRLLSILACAVGFSALTGCATSSFRDVPAPPQVAEMRGHQTPFPARPGPELPLNDQALVRDAIEGRETAARASSQPSAAPSDGSPRILSTSPLWIERVVGGTTLLQRISEADMTIVSELSLPGVGESIVEGQRLVHVTRDSSGQHVRAVSLLLGFVVGDWQLGKERARLIGSELATGRIHVRRGDEELVFTAGRQTPSSTVRISSR